MNWLQRLLHKPGSPFDGEACIRLLQDKAQPVHERDAAAESLMWYPKEHTCNALFEIIVDEKEDNGLRLTAATSLGVIWNEIGPNQSKLQKIPAEFKSEVLSNITT